MKYNVVIVEDELHQQEWLGSLLKEMNEDIRILGIASNIPDAVDLITKTEPDLVFLDVMLPPYTSFDLLDKFAKPPFDIIFTTSFEEFAVKAFRLSAIDYLVKPLVREELRQAIDKFIDRRLNKVNQDNLTILMTNLKSPRERQKKIALPTLSGFVFVTIEDIVRCESDNTYTTFYLRDKRKIVISKTLKDCENLLSEFSFCRVHHSNLINMEHIVEYQKGEGGLVKMIDGSSVDVSRRRKEEFMKIFQRIG